MYTGKAAKEYAINAPYFKISHVHSSFTRIIIRVLRELGVAGFYSPGKPPVSVAAVKDHNTWGWTACDIYTTMTKCLPDGPSEPVDMPTSAPPELVSFSESGKESHADLYLYKWKGLDLTSLYCCAFVSCNFSHVPSCDPNHPLCCGSIISHVKKRRGYAIALSELPIGGQNPRVN